MTCTLTTLMTSSSQSSFVKFIFSLFLPFFEIREGEGIRLLKRFGTEGRNGNILLCLLPPPRIKLMNREIASVINDFLHFWNKVNYSLNLRQQNDFPFHRRRKVFPKAVQWRSLSPKATKIICFGVVFIHFCIPSWLLGVPGLKDKTQLHCWQKWIFNPMTLTQPVYCELLMDINLVKYNCRAN